MHTRAHRNTYHTLTLTYTHNQFTYSIHTCSQFTYYTYTYYSTFHTATHTHTHIQLHSDTPSHDDITHSNTPLQYLYRSPPYIYTQFTHLTYIHSPHTCVHTEIPIYTQLQTRSCILIFHTNSHAFTIHTCIY